ncbi:MAG: class I SAM-dependent methyltransferase [Bacteroidia bacterium]|nr:class I SAM-dependent methyltransferase [Bacteroidia bacterium]NND12265.1 class I SAM-dependent methyltransferase [Flavobacteriaceae bacterium]MBT8309270.1 class I SAM-dependent methyltransferase [Bacteroidia bacterium]NNK27418.1 class I SAM-dependent methyltransferase [Flavobacteriaceae bacterium]NNL61073.1 class I SAM-dependent methyltransferase [Flavobacteriaceae bacterium]
MNRKEDYFEVNKETWNKKVSVHAKSEMYDLNAFKAGKSSLKSYELEALGDVSGKSLLHLQCHFGQDTMSWSRLGAKCTGIDISDEGIKLAKELNEELGLDAQFVCCNVLNTSDHLKETYDIVFTSYGTIGWLPNLKPWGRMISERLKPGGVFFIAEFHPIVWMFDYLSDTPKMTYCYNQAEAIYEEYEGTYADESSNMVSKEYGWNHGLGEVVTALTEAGLHIEYLAEHDESPYDVFPNLVATETGNFKTNDGLYPLIFTLKATKV